MKKFLVSLPVFACLFYATSALAGISWTPVSPDKAPKNLQTLHPSEYLLYTTDESVLRIGLSVLSSNPSDGAVISLPMPDGSFRAFRVWQTPVMPPALAAQYPEITTYTAEAIGNRSITAKLDFTLFGFHAMIYNGANTSFIDPFDNFRDGLYMVHYKKNETRALTEKMKCAVRSWDENGPAGESMELLQKGLPKLAAKSVNGYQLRTYRLALSANSYYCQAATGMTTPSITAALSQMATTMNRVNGVLEREVSVTTLFVNNETNLIWTTATGGVNGPDPFYLCNSDATKCLDTNQVVCDNIIGSANYDLGHAFTTGAGGLSDVGIACDNTNKAKSVTGSPHPVGDGFDIDYVVHEIGHELGANHTFNNGVDGSCGGGNVNPPTAYEPGSGSTIMAYAGICPNDDLQPDSDPYFHTASLEEILNYVSLTGDVCASKSPTGNKLVSYAPFAATYSIPYKTPFKLLAPIVADTATDSATLYCWEEWDLGDPGQRFISTHAQGPIFRSFDPTTDHTRVFPRLNMILAGSLNNAGIEDAQGEKVPDVARTLTFICTFRDILNNKGCFTVPDDQVTLNVINTGDSFTVTSQNTPGITYEGHSTQTISWTVASTNTAPINASDVDIFMSADGGYNWLYFVGTYPNTGSASITVPNPATTISTARFVVIGHANVFFNINTQNVTITNNSSFPVTPMSVSPVAKAPVVVDVFPIPASDKLYVVSGTSMHAVIYDLPGRKVWEGDVAGRTAIDVAGWSKGVYILHLTASGAEPVVKKFVVE